MSGRAGAPGPNRRRGPRPLLFHLSQAMLQPGTGAQQADTQPAGMQPAGGQQTGAQQTGGQQMGGQQMGAHQTGAKQADAEQAGRQQAGMSRTEAQTGSHPAGRQQTSAQPTGTHQADGSSAWPPAWTSWSESLRGCAAWDQPAEAGSDPPPPMPDAALLAGIAAYRRHPFERRVAEPPCIWQEGGSRLLDYGTAGTPPVLFVPSLVNRAYVLDLDERHSMLRFLAARGVRPLLLDWGWPDAAARSFTLTDYIAGRLERALEAVGTRVTLAGYCMGGLMTVAAATRRPDLVSRLVLLATPWDFWAGDPAIEDAGALVVAPDGGAADGGAADDGAAGSGLAGSGAADGGAGDGGAGARRLGAWLPLLEPVLSLGTLPVDALQMLFSLAEPGSVAAKYRAFGAQDQRSARAATFVAIEDWLSDGVPLAAPVAREVLGGWYGANTPARGAWHCAGLPVCPPRLPSFIAVPGRDRIVPPGSALALAAAMPDPVVVRPQAGHVGMVAGSHARIALWEPLLAWLRG